MPRAAGAADFFEFWSKKHHFLGYFPPVCTASPPLPPLGLLAACGCHSRWLSTSPMSLTARPPQSLLLAALRNRRQRTTSFREEVVRCRRFRSAGEGRIAADAAGTDNVTDGASAAVPPPCSASKSPSADDLFSRRGRPLPSISECWRGSDCGGRGRH